MNIKDAKMIPLSLILEKIGHQSEKEKNGEAIFYSPLRVEKTPSFHVNNAKNAWFDFGEGKGGNVIDFTCAYLASRQEANTVADTLRWLSHIIGNTPAIACQAPPVRSEKEPALFVTKTSAVKHRALTGYLAKRGIPLRVASPYLVQVTVRNIESRKSFFALGLPNEEAGYELRNPFFKGCILAKGISFIRGSQPKPDGIHLFEGMFDFLSVLAQHNREVFSDDVIVLNSLSCLNQSIPYIKNYGYRNAFTWLDNDKSGEKATLALATFFKTEEQLQHKPMNSLYRHHKDVNAWHTSKPLAPQ